MYVIICNIISINNIQSWIIIKKSQCIGHIQEHGSPSLSLTLRFTLSASISCWLASCSCKSWSLPSLRRPGTPTNQKPINTLDLSPHWHISNTYPIHIQYISNISPIDLNWPRSPPHLVIWCHLSSGPWADDSACPALRFPGSGRWRKSTGWSFAAPGQRKSSPQGRVHSTKAG